MKFVALVSGGKDSCFNVVHCLAAGHELVAMANLHPRKHRPEEIDSWMFQTVGYTAVEALAECAAVPLFRAEISEDEEAVVAELAQLFTHIKASGVEFGGISVGAIGSTYQQIRVDKACEACGLRSLTYLWQRDQAELLHEINSSGVDARIIKVAGMGLERRHLGMKLADAEPELLEMHSSFGLHPCGEGGEYETMVFDAPFFKKKLEIVSQEVIHHSTDDVYYLKFDVKTIPKQTSTLASVRIPSLLDPFFTSLPSTPVQFASKSHALSPASSFDENLKRVPLTGGGLLQMHVCGSFEAAFAQLSANFEANDISSCFHVLVAIKDMSRFAEMNEYYKRVFTRSAQKLGAVPPSRACIQTATSHEVELTVYSFRRSDASGKGIHVQGLSYWAPASIGPYSQCRMEYGISYVAGQIGLVPQTLDLASNLRVEALLALQNAFRILDVVHEVRKNWQPALAIVYITDISSIELTRNIWKSVSSLPLIHVEVKELPRGANVEWSLQACDLRYFAYFVPDTDEEDKIYASKPELSCGSSKHTFRIGFQSRKVQCQALKNPIFTFSTSSMDGAILATSLHYNGIKVSSIYVS